MRRALRWLAPSRPADTIAVALAAVATAAVLVNALALQPSPHPAPLFAEPPAPVANRENAMKRTVPAAPAPRVAAAPTPPQRPETAAVPVRSDLVADVQHELKGLGFYDDAIDGLLGPRTSQAIRDFEQAQGLKMTGQPSPMLLDVMRRARARPETTGAVEPSKPQPSLRVLAVQRVLARLGYGPVNLNGMPDPATRAAIEQFERDRGLPRSGEVSDRLIGELATVTGAPVE